MQTKIDHLVIGAATLEQGVNYVKSVLGIDIPAGGEHLSMGTHNHLMRLGNEIFLEVIAPHPNIDAPEGPRWFGLDDPYVRKQIEQQPCLLTWVVNTTDIKRLLSQTKLCFGEASLISRGNLSWYFGVPEDGRLLASGMLPYVMQWRTDTHPANKMADLNCRLRALHIFHPRPHWLETALTSIAALELVQIHPLPHTNTAYLLAEIETPTGIKELRSPTLE